MHWWYAPNYTLVSPAPNMDRTASPFLFSYRQVGVTADGKPAIDATIRFTLQSGMSDATKAALQAKGNPPAKPLPPLGLSIALELPFLDQSNTLRTQRFDVQENYRYDNRITVILHLLNDWARLGYGALAVAGFQSQPARLVVAYSYRAYVPMPRKRLQIALGGKEAVTPVVLAAENERSMPQRALVNAAALEVRTPIAAMRFQPERPANLPAGPVDASAPASDAQFSVEARLPAALAAGTAVAASPVAARPVIASRPALDVTATETVKPVPHPIVMVPRPDLVEASVLQQVLNTTDYVMQTLAVQQKPDALLPCNTLGAFYCRGEGTGLVAVGCQDALQLGKTTYRQYEEIPELRDPLYAIYRSLQQPGRFLVLPAAYRITRYAASDPHRPYRPVIVLHASLDANHPENNQYVYEATLQADLPPYVRRLLRDRLLAYAQSPTLVYPTEIECTAAYAWVLGIPNVTHIEMKIPEGFWISFATGMGSAPLLQSLLEGGVSGTVTFTLPDGSSLLSRLEMDLHNITGPWDEGPIAVTLQNGAATLTNSIESQGLPWGDRP